MWFIIYFNHKTLESRVEILNPWVLKTYRLVISVTDSHYSHGITFEFISLLITLCFFLPFLLINIQKKKKNKKNRKDNKLLNSFAARIDPTERRRAREIFN